MAEGVREKSYRRVRLNTSGSSSNLALVLANPERRCGVAVWRLDFEPALVSRLDNDNMFYLAPSPSSFATQRTLPARSSLPISDSRFCSAWNR